MAKYRINKAYLKNDSGRFTTIPKHTVKKHVNDTEKYKLRLAKAMGVDPTRINFTYNKLND